MNTSTQIQAFAFDSNAVRVVMIDDAHWFVARDVCACLGIDRTQTRKLDDDERGVYLLHSLNGGKQETAVINESGLYTLILRSQGATTPGTPAHTFRKWVTSEVLPSIRKTGSYAAPGAPASTPASLEASIDKLVTVVTKLVDTLPLIVQSVAAARQAPRRKAKRMYTGDMEHILALRESGAALEDIIANTGFSRTQVWCVLVGQCEVKPGGRVTVNWRSHQRRMADQQVQRERGHEIAVKLGMKDEVTA